MILLYIPFAPIVDILAPRISNLGATIHVNQGIEKLSEKKVAKWRESRKNSEKLERFKFLKEI